jgi:hypothetical protein
MSINLGVNYNLYGTPTGKTPSLKLARVLKVILGPREADGSVDTDFEENGKWASIGSVVFAPLLDNSPAAIQTSPKSRTKIKTPRPIAKPLYSSMKQFPVVGEIIELVTGPADGSRMNKSPTEIDVYYMPPYNLWNNVHHNAFPNLIQYANQTPSPKVNYNDVENGVTTNNTAPQTSNFKLGSTFRELSNISNLQPFEGDIVVEGRWGQSIRFGSTVKGSSVKNPWSGGEAAKDGDPIVIIRNGQGVQDTTFIGPVEPWIPVVENINTDAASIYLCSGQSIIIQDLSNFKLDSFMTDSKTSDDATQRTSKVPTSTDNISAKKQAQYQLTNR